MKCPKCGADVGERDVICSHCGAELFVDTALADKLFGGASEPFEQPENIQLEKKRKKPGFFSGEGRAAEKKQLDFNKIKIGIIALGVLILVILLIIIITNLLGTKGEKIAKQASDFVGADFEVAEKKLDAKFKKESAYKGLSSVVAYDRIAESEDDVRINGFTYPEWAVFITLDDEGRIVSVKYSDFNSIKKDIRGEKKQRIVNLDKFSKGTSQKSVENEIDMEPYSITYTKDGEAHTFRYWYENDNGDEQPVVLTVQYDSDGDFVSYVSIPIYPQLL